MNPNPPNSIILEIKNLLAGYKVRNGFIFRHKLDLSIRKGELVALVGKNGVGKSTLLRTLAGLQKPLGGDIYLSGKRITEYSSLELSTMVGFVSTEPVLVNNMKVFDLIALGRYPYTNWFGRNRPADLENIQASMEMVGISHLRDKNIFQISDGERQRAMIARTLAQDTQLIIMDEPTAFLDLPNKYEVVHLLKTLSREYQKAVVFSTHELGIAIDEADKIWLQTEEGIQQGSPEDLILQKQFSSMFDQKAASYISDKGELKIKRKFSGKIALNGTGKDFLMTRKALERIGYEVHHSSGDKNQVTILSSEDGTKWIIHSEGTEKVCCSIYELMNSIRYPVQD
jgi:iron complex transport system ATP-binding protein